MTYREYVDEAARYSDELATIRRDLHRIPEMGLQNPKTAERILQSIHGLGEIFKSEASTGIALLIKGKLAGPTVLLRSDTDGLAINEETEVEYASTNGFMHSCGHDMHMAMAIGAAHLLHTHRDRLNGNVVIWFQPGEEGHGGADLMLKENLHLVSGELPIACYGLHVGSAFELGLFASKPGPLCASAGGVVVTFKGKGGHGSAPWYGNDPITPMLEAAQALQNIATKKISAFEPAVINIGWVKAGDDTASNVIPETASFGATIRTFNDEVTEKIKNEITTLSNGIASGYGLEVTVEFSNFTHAVINDEAAIDRVKRIIASSFDLVPGFDARYEAMDKPVSGGEDFSSIQKVIPGAFVFMGAMPLDADLETVVDNHSNKAYFDDSKLSDGSALLAALAFDTLNDAANI